MRDQTFNITINGVDIHISTRLEDYRSTNEDGESVTHRLWTTTIYAETKKGKQYVAGAMDHQSAKEMVASLPRDFDPATHPSFVFERNSYGSQAYAEDGDEWAQIERERSSW